MTDILPTIITVVASVGVVGVGALWTLSGRLARIEEAAKGTRHAAETDVSNGDTHYRSLHDDVAAIQRTVEMDSVEAVKSRRRFDEFADRIDERHERLAASVQRVESKLERVESKIEKFHGAD